MGFHTFSADEAERLEDPTRFRFCSREELLQWLPSESGARLLDIGSGTGFYTDELAPFYEEIVALDVQHAMHELYRERGMPGNVLPVTADAEQLPFGDQSFEGIFSTMTFHESTSDASIAELFRILTPGGRVVIVDWSGDGNGEAGPPRSERYDLSQARAFLESAGFEVVAAATRSETFALVGKRE